MRSRSARGRPAGSCPRTETMPPVRVAVALEDLDGRRLARAVGAEEAEHLAAGDVEVDPADRVDVAVGLAQVADEDGRGARSPSRAMTRGPHPYLHRGCAARASTSGRTRRGCSWPKPRATAACASCSPSAPSRALGQPPGARRSDPARRRPGRRGGRRRAGRRRPRRGRAHRSASWRPPPSGTPRTATTSPPRSSELAGLAVRGAERGGGGAPGVPRRDGVARRTARRPARRRRRRRRLVRARGGDARRGRRAGRPRCRSGRGCSPTSTCATTRRRRPQLDAVRAHVAGVLAELAPAAAGRGATRSAAARRRCGGCWGPVLDAGGARARAPRARGAARARTSPAGSRCTPSARACSRRDPAPRGGHGRLRNPAADLRRRPARGRPAGGDPGLRSFTSGVPRTRVACMAKARDVDGLLPRTPYALAAARVVRVRAPRSSSSTPTAS